MLDELLVENLGLIATAHVEPGPGLVAVTGETGAGKTLLLGALRLLRGDTARTDRIGPSAEEARVEGRFLLDDGTEIVAARRLADGRSRAYLDGSLVPARVLEERLGPLVEIVGQHEHVAIGRERTIRAIVDARLDTDGVAALGAYRAAWSRLETLRADRATVGGDRRGLERELDLARHQAAEITAARVRPGEDNDLGTRIDRLRHAEEIAAALEAAHGAVGDDGGAVDLLGRALAVIRKASAFDPDLAAVAVTLEAVAAEAGEAALSLRRAADEVEQDPDELEAANRRLALLGDLRRKYGDTLDEVVAYAETADARAEEISRLLQRADSLDAEIAAAETEVSDAARHLGEARRRAAKAIVDPARLHLVDLGLRDPVLEISFDRVEPSASGADRLRLRFASDSALDPGPVSRVASGGELSRLVLAIRLAAGIADSPILAFDEVDAGIGGATALAMGEKLARLAAQRQVLVVTHLPQVAAFADTHIVVERDGGRASVRTVADSERIAEITRMLGGLPESDRGRRHADELLSLARQRRAEA